MNGPVLAAFMFKHFKSEDIYSGSLYLDISGDHVRLVSTYR